MTLDSLGPEYVLRGNEVRDGAGVRIHRLFGSPETYSVTDPFLLLDFFGSKNPEDYISGFPWHPHRGIETLTYLLNGKIDHEDSIGNKGTLRPGEIQWMTAGSGIFHQEMPMYMNESKEMKGFQLWINLKSTDKFTKPSYRHINVQSLKKFSLEGREVKIISGSFSNSLEVIRGDHELSVTYLDISTNGKALDLQKGDDVTSIIIPIEGDVMINNVSVKPKEAAILERRRGHVEVNCLGKSRFIYLSGKRINEKIAWYGPVVMNTWNEIKASFKELENGTFVRDKSPGFLSY